MYIFDFMRVLEWFVALGESGGLAKTHLKKYPCKYVFLGGLYIVLI